MFEDNTVFVIGAGASQEFGLPVGWDLLREIRDNSFFDFSGGPFPTTGNWKIFNAVHQRYEKDQNKMNKVFRAFGDIHSGVDTAGSIDEFINRHADDPIIAEIGKVQIAHAILKAEAISGLVPLAGREADGINWDNTESTWIAPFARALFDGVRAKDVETLGNNIAIICFNYDRCIEHYLEYAIQKAYRGVERKQARQIVKGMNIIHPYGSLGDISQISFGTPLEHADLYHVTENLITWSESIEEDTMVRGIHDAIIESRNLVFMGFAFANQNMELLNGEIVSEKAYFTDVYSTGLGLTKDIEFKLKKKITQLYAPDSTAQKYHDRIKIMYDVKCARFFKEQLQNFVA
ncbi:SIR2 family protein [Rhizobium ruizarguesonis]|uniref:SIR2 family protein n=1 Tax=Rhizobium ruizarguesonis TaxID=2081791 RepID=UPI0010325FAB|nr:SIR2 family protein [Rhizobium ruizarguesonis]TAV15144.1 hypothetical protein ELI34_06665 [Rhizobium ruizarguesonis]TAV27602.1 hypothetical protein ELI35_07985 [Rhizobium ruizarguesonis]TAW71576.1 hypothetical protein ELI16_06235 [Rhizobium ruizarguesonis]TAW92972.1 hypothetical protein ELI11_06760 [Rhizobium ruizarguesonis]